MPHDYVPTVFFYDGAFDSAPFLLKFALVFGDRVAKPAQNRANRANIHAHGMDGRGHHRRKREHGEEPASKNQIQPECGGWAGRRRTGRSNPSRETKFLAANGDRNLFIFPVQLTTSRVCNHTRLMRPSQPTRPTFGALLL